MRGTLYHKRLFVAEQDIDALDSRMTERGTVDLGTSLLTTLKTHALGSRCVGYHFALNNHSLY